MEDEGTILWLHRCIDGPRESESLGTTQYIEPHLAVVSMSAVVVCLLVYSDGLRRWRLGVLASLALWSLSRSGEGSGDAVIAGLVVIGPVIATLLTVNRSQHASRVLLGVIALAVPFLLLADVLWMMAAMERVTRAFADPRCRRTLSRREGRSPTRSHGSAPMSFCWSRTTRYRP